MFIAEFAVLSPFRARAFGCRNPGGSSPPANIPSASGAKNNDFAIY